MAFISGGNQNHSAVSLNSEELNEFDSTPKITKIPEESKNKNKEKFNGSNYYND